MDEKKNKFGAYWFVMKDSDEDNDILLGPVLESEYGRDLYIPERALHDNICIQCEKCNDWMDWTGSDWLCLHCQRFISEDFIKSYIDRFYEEYKNQIEEE